MNRLTFTFFYIFVSFLISGCDNLDTSTEKNQSASTEKPQIDTLPTPAPQAKNQAISFPCLNPPSIPGDPGEIAKSIPGDTPITSQDSLNCFAWQVFIGLNLQVDPQNPGVPDSSAKPSEFGEPGTTQTAVWETYANINNVMRKNAEPPLPWGDNSVAVSACSSAMQGKAPTQKVRIMASSRSAASFNLSEDAAQAFPSNNPNWLADKNGNPVFYEILMGKDQYDYINNNTLYNLDVQVKRLQNNQNIVLPMGHGEVLGGLEIKAAWLQVADPKNSRWQRFKTTTAYVYDKNTQACAEQTMALVGLHIIHKTASQPQWVWATFEQIDNAPDTTQIKSDGTVDGEYTFYNNSCTVQDVPSTCKAKTVNGEAVTQTSCQANISPAYYLTGTDNCPVYPVRVSRDFNIKDTTDDHIKSLNTAVQTMIKQANADSVYANYQLVNVLWSSAAVNDNEPSGNPPLAPLSTSGETPPLTTVPVANTTLETYAQGFNCLSCHRYASISPAAGSEVKNYATDYSFIFSFAQSPQ